jgi:hypothetical protein
MVTCEVYVEISIDRRVMKTKTWPACDVMKTGPTRAWATRQFNAFLKDLNECAIGKDKVVSVRWTAQYGETQGFIRFSGWLSGVNGKTLARRGIFED